MSILNKIDLKQPVEFLAYRVEGVHGRPIENLDGFTMPPESAQALIRALAEACQLDVVLESLQSLVERNDGVKLQTAMPTLIEFKAALQKLHATAPEGLIEWLDRAEACNANEVTINFVEAPTPMRTRSITSELPERPHCSAELLRDFVSSHGEEAPEQVRQALKGLQLQAKGASATLHSSSPLDIEKGHELIKQGQQLMAKHQEAAQCIVNFVMSRDGKSIVDMNDDDAFALLLGLR